jgi:hypothetical protein
VTAGDKSFADGETDYFARWQREVEACEVSIQGTFREHSGNIQ